jgi:Protein of unknown function (DUF3153)
MTTRSPLSVTKIILRQFIKLRLLWFILVSILFLSGCIHYDAGINFADANHGELVQHIRLKSQSSALDESLVASWVANLEQRTQALGGRTRQVAAREWRLSLPFYNAKDLETKFNQLSQSTAGQQRDLPVSRLQVKTLNRLLWQRNELQYNLDLRSLRATLQNNFSDSLDLEFKLRTPWGARVPSTDGELSAMRRSGWQLVWKLKPGTMNHIEAVFLVPSPLGIGFVVIALFVAGGAMFSVLSLSATDIATDDGVQEIRG